MLGSQAGFRGVHGRRFAFGQNRGPYHAKARGATVIDLLCEALVPKFRRAKFSRRNPIIGMEMLAPLALIHIAARKFANKSVNLYIDNVTASNTLTRGDFDDPILAATIAAFWRQAERLGLDVWIGRVGSKVNPADLPARNGELPFLITDRVQFKNLFKLLYTTLSNESKWPVSERETFQILHTVGSSPAWCDNSWAKAYDCRNFARTKLNQSLRS